MGGSKGTRLDCISLYNKTRRASVVCSLFFFASRYTDKSEKIAAKWALNLYFFSGYPSSFVQTHFVSVTQFAAVMYLLITFGMETGQTGEGRANVIAIARVSIQVSERAAAKSRTDAQEKKSSTASIPFIAAHGVRRIPHPVDARSSSLSAMPKRALCSRFCTIYAAISG